ncbi:MAG: hypothetical protein NWE95_13600 [Candidatus Bathyarchaeota archaeon]|nr:hypothetical protein [Candidatus Bathyarchaeota archaeon]
MASVVTVRREFLDELWLPLLREGGAQLYPLRRNKKMKILVFTDENGNKEITAYINSRLTNKEEIFAWTETFPKAARLETYCPIKIIGASRFQDSPLQNTENLAPYLPFDALIIDFSRQSSIDTETRLEQEITCIEHLLVAQKQRKEDIVFVFIYTTVIDAQTLNCEIIKQASDNIHFQNWAGLTVIDLPTNTVEAKDKISIIENVLMQFALKFNFTVDLRRKVSDLLNGQKLYSVCGIFKPCEQL